MNVLVLGSGGREHALSWKIAQSSQLNQLFIAPGNAGTMQVGKNVPIEPTDFESIKTLVLEHQIGLVIVGPEAPLVEGIHDFFLSNKELKDVTIIGPEKAGALLEGSKDFAKSFMAKYNIPTARYKTFTKETIAEGDKFLEQLKSPYVLKADGLAAGKGVVIHENIEDAKQELREMLSESKFGKASEKVVVEEFLEGIEMSAFIITNGKSYKVLPSAKDYKRIGEKDTGLNTGGMGAVSPVLFNDKEFADKVENQIIIPTIKGLKAEEINYKGFLFIGLMNVNGNPYVIEYNVRLGDPETEVVMMRLKSDLLDLFEGIITDTLSERDVEIDPRTAVTVMMVSGGYPGNYEKGKEIVGLGEEELSTVFHAGTKKAEDAVVTNGGRVLAVTALGKNLETALKNAYQDVEKIKFSDHYYRKDIGYDLFKSTEKA